jgi:hypothetical protein
MAVRRLAALVMSFPFIAGRPAKKDPRTAFLEPEVTTYKFTIEGKISAADATKAYAALSEIIGWIADSLEANAPQIELKEEIRITLLPLPRFTAGCRCWPADLARGMPGVGGADSTPSHLRSGGTDG